MSFWFVGRYRFLLVAWSMLAAGLAIARGGAPAPAVVVARAELRDLAPVDYFTGTVISREQAQLAAEVAGRLLEVADVGQAFARGEVVARIDDELLRQDHAERLAEIQRIEARLKFLGLEVSRLERLARSNNAARSQLEQTQSDRLAARAELAAARARERRAAALLERARLRARFDGVVTERLLNTGEWASVGDAVLTMTDTAHLEVQGWVSLSALPFLETGAVLAFEREGQRYEGRVRTLVPVGDTRSRLYELRVNLPEQGEWRVGESVRLAVPAAAPRKVLAVPRDALVLRRDAVAVYVVDSSDVAHRVPVVPGIGSDGWIEVGGELAPGDRVVIRGGERLRDGQKVSLSGGVVDP